MIVAQFDSKCPGCGEPIVGELDAVGRVEGEWCCEACVENTGGEDDYLLTSEED